MKKNLFLWQFAGFSLTSLGGTLLHFLYEWTNQNLLIAPFSGVNESTWEHMKLLYFPLFIFALIQSRFSKEYQNFWCVKLIGILTGLLWIPIMYYTYNGAIGKSPDWLNITIFFIATGGAFLAETFLFRKNKPPCHRPRFAFVALLLIGICFILFTFFPPYLPVFQDPLNGTYGIT